ncbi:MAG: YaaL family protein [Lawsonibacter sp.]|nr:YaaL family protein [Lawsonibacter sp.]
MAQSVRKPALRRGDPAREEERRELMSSLSHTRTLINQAYGGFNTASDADLIESYVFEINALQARYNYLLRRVKELEELT